jgi:SWI/SNF-related matrix-associated actin-dependent regulator 1 of chromatin subfamily A
LAEELGLSFSKPRIVMTVRGEREVRNAIEQPGEAFWAAWRARKEQLKAQGIGVSKTDGRWQVALWTETMSVTARSEAQEASRAVDAAIEVPVPQGMELMPFQRAGVAYALSREGTLIGDEMGTGKTIQAICIANATAPQHILVVAPASLLINWRNEIGRWQTLGLPVHVIRPGVAFGSEPGWYLINYDILGKYESDLKARTWCLLIADECQYLKTRTSQRTQMLLGGSRKIKGSKPPRYEQITPVQAKRRLALTGTPIMNRPAELFPILHALDGRRWPTWSTFARRYCAAHSNGYGYDATGASNLDELNLRLRQTVMVRRLKKDVLTELPAKRRQIVDLAVDDETTRAIVEHEVETYERTEAAIAEASTEMDQAKAAGDDAAYKTAVAKLTAARGIAFSEMSRVRHETALAKVPAVIERLADVEGKALVYAHHLDVLDALEAALSDRGVVRIDGGTKPEDRQSIVQRFQEDPSIQFFLGGIKAAGVGLTLTAASQVYFAELDWTPAAVTQV